MYQSFANFNRVLRINYKYNSEFKNKHNISLIKKKTFQRTSAVSVLHADHDELSSMYVAHI